MWHLISVLLSWRMMKKSLNSDSLKKLLCISPPLHYPVNATAAKIGEQQLYTQQKPRVGRNMMATTQFSSAFFFQPDYYNLEHIFQLLSIKKASPPRRKILRSPEWCACTTQLMIAGSFRMILHFPSNDYYAKWLDYIILGFLMMPWAH